MAIFIPWQTHSVKDHCFPTDPSFEWLRFWQLFECHGHGRDYGAGSRSMAGRFGVESPLVHSKNFPTYPWNIPQTPNQQFMKEILSFGAGYVGGSLRFTQQKRVIFSLHGSLLGGGKNSMFFAAYCGFYVRGCCFWGVLSWIILTSNRWRKQIKQNSFWQSKLAGWKSNFMVFFPFKFLEGRNIN